MIPKILGLVLVLAITWIWMNRGFFNSMIHMVCTIAAGAIAFAVWEPIAHILLGMTPEKGFLTFLAYIAWGVALLVPFAVSLVALRGLTDLIVKAKIQTMGVVDYIGGGVCGAVSATITVGILFIGYGFMPGAGGVRPLSYSESSNGIGSLQRTGGLWIPAERLTAGIYGQLSKTSLSTAEPLAEWYPDLDLTGYAINISVADGKARPSIDPEDVGILKTYFIGDEDGSTRMPELLVADENPGAFVQPYTDIDGEPVQSGRLFGAVVEFSEGAKETNGQVIIGNGQAALIMRNFEGTKSAHPVALISQARSSDADLYGRFRYDGEDLFIASVGGASKATMGFEFVVPAGYAPIALTIKNTRFVLDDEEPQSYPNPTARFAALNSGGLVGGSKVANLDTSDAETYVSDGPRQRGKTAVNASKSLGFSFEKRQKGGLDVNENNQILRGKQKFLPDDLDARGISKNVVIKEFAVTPDVVIVKVDVSPQSKASLLGRAAQAVDRVLPPQLIDTDGRAYQAVGYIYKDNKFVEISYNPAQSIRGLAQVPTISSSRSDQELTLIFRVSKGVEIKTFAIGSKAILEISPPMLAK